MKKNINNIDCIAKIEITEANGKTRCGYWMKTIKNKTKKITAQKFYRIEKEITKKETEKLIDSF